MSVAGFPQDVVHFVAEYIHSVEQLEALLLLRAEQRAWSAADVSARLLSSPASVAMRLADLHVRGLVRQEGEKYRYAVSDPAQNATIGALIALYRTRKDAVIGLIFSQPAARPLSKPKPDRLQSFADAFRLRRDDISDGKETR